MKLNRLKLGAMLTALSVFGVYWAVGAQDRPLAPPQAARYPNQTQPLEKKKPADPSLIIPPDVFDLPRPISAPVEIKPAEVVQTGGQLPPPMFPPLDPPKAEKQAPIAPALPPAPLAEPKKLIPPPIPEPTKALIVDPPVNDASKKAADDLKPPASLSIPPPQVLPAGKKALTPPSPFDLPPVKNEVEAPLPRNDDAPAPRVVVPMKKDPVPTGPLVVTETPIGAPPKSFIRLRADIAPPATVTVTPAREPAMVLPPKTPGEIPPPPAVTPAAGALVNLQTPAILVEKRGPASMQAGETQLYQIVVRNLGNLAAQQIRVEDEMPAGVRLLNADIPPQMQGARASWVVPALAPGNDYTLRLTLKADASVRLANNTSVHVSAASVTTRVATMPMPSNFTVRVAGPERVNIGKTAVFDIHVTNSSGQALTDIVLHADLPAGLVMQVKDESGALREERRIEGPVTGMAIAPGEHKILKMPATAVKPGRFVVPVKVATAQGEKSAATEIEVASDTLVLGQAPTTRLLPGRDVDLRIELANHTAKPLRNVQVATVLPDGFTFLGASDRGLYQSNSRTAYWLFDVMPVGASKTLIVRVNTSKTGQYQNVVSARADGLAESRSVGTILLEGVSDLSMRVIDRDNPIELGRETVYEIQVQNNGSAPATNVRVQAQFPAGLAPKNAQGNTRYSIDRQNVVFEPIASLAPQGQAIFRVSAQAQTAGKDQRVRFAVVSAESPTPVQREIGVMVYSGN